MIDNTVEQMSSPKSFGIVFSIVFFFIELYIYVYQGHISFYFIIISLILLLISFKKPLLLVIPNQIWYKFGIILSKITNPIILFVIFYLFFFPTSIVIKIFKGNLLNKSFDNKIETYWEQREIKINSMKDQF